MVCTTSDVITGTDHNLQRPRPGTTLHVANRNRTSYGDKQTRALQQNTLRVTGMTRLSVSKQETNGRICYGRPME